MDLQQDNLQADVITYNAAIWAKVKGRQQALLLFINVQRVNSEADGVTYNAAIGAREKDQQ